MLAISGSTDSAAPDFAIVQARPRLFAFAFAFALSVAGRTDCARFCWGRKCRPGSRPLCKWGFAGWRPTRPKAALAAVEGAMTWRHWPRTLSRVPIAQCCGRMREEGRSCFLSATRTLAVPADCRSKNAACPQLALTLIVRCRRGLGRIPLQPNVGSHGPKSIVGYVPRRLNHAEWRSRQKKGQPP